jgi:hypothetical protein
MTFAAAVITLGFAMYSCQLDQEQPKCTGNCIDIIIGGRVYAVPDGAAFPNVSVDVFWGGTQFMSLATYRVASGKTDNNGYFSFNANINPGWFKDYILHANITVEADTNYITDSYTNRKLFSNLNIAELQNINFKFYRKTNLTIKLERTQKDSIEYLNVTHEFGSGIFYSDYAHHINNGDFPTSEVIKIKTAANVYTKITWNKEVGGVSNIQTDSLFCTKNGDNVYNLNY